ncbi:MAG: hypothetical protein FWF44_10980 [Defluviitaleaceae bacterium]|nr:hypothetical protein [Defluviitaleaceae bacterium]
MFTSFTRVIISLQFLRSALGTQQMPPTQVLVGLALFITFFLMGPILSDINNNALKPYSEGQITQQEALDRGMARCGTSWRARPRTRTWRCSSSCPAKPTPPATRCRTA